MRNANVCSKAALSQALRESNYPPSAALLDIALGHDTSGNVSSIRRNHDPRETAASVYAYDGLNRVKTITAGTGATAAVLASFTYTPTGNIKTKAGVGTYSYGLSGQVDTAAQTLPHAVRDTTDATAGNHHYSYDDTFGRMITRGGPTVPTGSQSFTYSALGMVRTITDALATVESYQYGTSSDRVVRVKSDGTRTVYASGGIYETDVDASGAMISETLRVITQGQAIVEIRQPAATVATKHYLHREQLGSVELVTNADGTEFERAEYDAYGAIASGSTASTTVGFTGHRQDQGLGLVDMGARFYDAHLGRFISPDPTIPEPTYGQAFDRFAYAYNNPATLVDPTGLEPGDPNESSSLLTIDSGGEWSVGSGSARGKSDGSPLAVALAVGGAVATTGAIVTFFKWVIRHRAEKRNAGDKIVTGGRSAATSSSGASVSPSEAEGPRVEAGPSGYVFVWQDWGAYRAGPR